MTDNSERPNVSIGGNVGGHVTTGDNNQVNAQPTPIKWWQMVLNFIVGFFTKTK